jgi:hypothetical protein
LREFHAVHCHLPWNGGRPLLTPIVTVRRPWFNHLIAFAISEFHASLKLKHCRTYVVWYFLLLFNKELHYGELMCEFCLTLYKNLATDLQNIAVLNLLQSCCCCYCSKAWTSHQESSEADTSSIGKKCISAVNFCVLNIILDMFFIKKDCVLWTFEF